MIFNKFLWILSIIFLFSISFVSAVATAPDSADTIVYWALEDLTDETGTYTLSNNGATGGATGIIDDAYSFDGSNDFLDGGDIDLAYTSGISISAWVYMDSLGKVIISKRDNTNYAFDFTFGATGVLYFGINSNTYRANTGTFELDTDTWYHVVGTYDKSNIKIYVDGDEKGTLAYTGNIDNTLTVTTIGKRSYTGAEGFFDGLIDEVSIFDYGLSSDEVEFLYNSGSPSSAQQYPFSGGSPALPVSIDTVTFSPSTVYAVNDISATVTVNDTTDVKIKYYWLVNDVNKTSGVVTAHSGYDFSIPSLDEVYFDNGDVVKLSTVALSVSDDSVLSAVDDSTKTVSDIPLIQSNIIINPSTIYTDSYVDGVVDLSYYSDVRLYYSWNVEGDNVTSGTVSTYAGAGIYTIPYLDDSLFVQGDDIILIITPKDSSNVSIGSTVSSVTKTVTNRNPTVESLTFNPDPLIDTIDGNLYCNVADGDDDLINVSWVVYKNDVSTYSGSDLNVASGTNVNIKTISRASLVEDDEWYFTCTATDGYSGSSGLQTSSTSDVTTISNFTVQLSDYWSSSPINSFWVTINGTNYSTTNGTIVTPVLKNDGLEYTLDFGSSGYLSSSEYESYETYPYSYESIELTDNLIASLHHSRINFNSFELITGFNISSLLTSTLDINYTVVDYGKQNQFFEFSPPTGNYTVIADAKGYFSANTTFSVFNGDVGIVDVPGLYDTVFNLSFLKHSDNDSINSFNGYLYEPISDTNISFSTNNGTALIPCINNTDYIISVSSDGFATVIDNVTVNSSILFNYTIYAYTFNSVRINIYNDTSTNLLTQLVTINSVWDGTSMVNTTSNGTIIIDFLDPESYELRFVSANYLNTSYFITVTNDSTQEINVHLPLATGKELQRFVVVDQIGELVPSAIIRLQQEVVGFDGLYQTVDEKKTNTDGEAGFYVSKSTNVFYRMIVIYDGVVELVTDKTLFLPSVSEIISLQIDTSSIEDTSVDNVVSTFVWSGALNNTFTFSWIDPDNSITGGRLLITVEDFNLTGVPPDILYDASLDGSTGSLSYTLPVVNDTKYVVNSYIVWSSYDELVDSQVKIFGRTVVPDKNLGLILAAVVFLFVAFITISLKPLFSSVLSFGVLAILNGFHLISIGVTVITSFIALAIIFFIKTKGGGQ